MPTVKYKVNPVKLAKAPVSLTPMLFAHFEYDSSSPYFYAIRPYMFPATPEERWEELVSLVRMEYQKLNLKIERKFLDESARSNRRFEQMKLQFR